MKQHADSSQQQVGAGLAHLAQKPPVLAPVGLRGTGMACPKVLLPKSRHSGIHLAFEGQ